MLYFDALLWHFILTLYFDPLFENRKIVLNHWFFLKLLKILHFIKIEALFTNFTYFAFAET